jgi:hypothetical protein
MRERGTGSIFNKPGTKNKWISYSFRGHQYQESSGSPDPKVAKKLLRERLKKVTKPNFVDPAKEQRHVLSDMLTQLKLDYERKGNRSFHTVKSVFQHLEEHFKFTGLWTSRQGKFQTMPTNAKGTARPKVR